MTENRRSANVSVLAPLPPRRALTSDHDTRAARRLSLLLSLLPCSPRAAQHLSLLAHLHRWRPACQRDRRLSSWQVQTLDQPGSPHRKKTSNSLTLCLISAIIAQEGAEGGPKDRQVVAVHRSRAVAPPYELPDSSDRSGVIMCCPFAYSSRAW
jgi:hypothetical protein